MNKSQILTRGQRNTFGRRNLDFLILLANDKTLNAVTFRLALILQGSKTKSLYVTSRSSTFKMP